jgi:hypothetical protein
METLNAAFLGKIDVIRKMEAEIKFFAETFGKNFQKPCEAAQSEHK